MAHFGPGDIVQHITGGPAMAVDTTAGETANCSWLDYAGHAQRAAFNFSVLKKADPGVAIPGGTIGGIV